LHGCCLSKSFAEVETASDDVDDSVDGISQFLRLLRLLLIGNLLLLLLLGPLWLLHLDSLFFFRLFSCSLFCFLLSLLLFLLKVKNAAQFLKRERVYAAL
jgi:hypothetical protein